MHQARMAPDISTMPRLSMIPLPSVPNCQVHAGLEPRRVLGNGHCLCSILRARLRVGWPERPHDFAILQIHENRISDAGVHGLGHRAICGCLCGLANEPKPTGRFSVSCNGCDCMRPCRALRDNHGVAYSWVRDPFGTSDCFAIPAPGWGWSGRGSTRLCLIQPSFECRQCFITHVVLDSLRVTFRGFLIDSETDEKRHHDAVPPTASLCQCLTSLSQEH